MKASTVLRKARKLIKTSGHTKGELARNKYRHRVDPTNPNAIRFCAYGAIQSVLGVKDSGRETLGTLTVRNIAEYLSRTIPDAAGYYNWSSVDGYNDREYVTPKDVDKWFSRAIKLAEKVGD